MRVGLKKKKKKRQNVKTYNRPDLAPARDIEQRQRSEGGWVENLRGGFLKINVMNTVSDPVSVCLLERNVLVPTYFGISLHIVLGLPLFYIYIYIIDKKKSI